MPKVSQIMPGTTFGRLTVVSKSDRKGRKNQTMYNCLCECGAVITVRNDALVSNGQKSCGCIGKEQLIQMTRGKTSPHRKDLTDRRFGMLTAIEIAPSKGNRGYWRCRCDCGNICVVSAQNLMRGLTTSCGCVGDMNILACRRAQVENELKEGTNLSSLSNIARKNNTTGRRGVSWNKRKQLYVAKITFQGNRYYLGSFKSFEKAVIAREEAEEKLYNSILEKYGRPTIENPARPKGEISR